MIVGLSGDMFSQVKRQRRIGQVPLHHLLCLADQSGQRRLQRCAVLPFYVEIGAVQPKVRELHHLASDPLLACGRVEENATPTVTMTAATQRDDDSHALGVRSA
eukprot:COSAG06_NODE_8742_length_2081_cov_3.933401_2_plen_104_part_00